MRRAFTLIELLVVIAIIALLIAILLPALNGVRATGKALVCGKKLAEIGMAVAMYAQDNEDFLPRSSHSASMVGTLRWGQAIMPYVNRGTYRGAGTDTDWNNVFNGLYRCPADKRRNSSWSYGKNVWFELAASEVADASGTSTAPTYWRIHDTRNPGGTVLFGEMLDPSAADHFMAHFWLMGGTPEVDVERHEKKPNFEFLDGHIERLPFTETYNPDIGLDNWNPNKRRMAKQ